MVILSLSNRGLHKAGLLLALFSSSLFAYTPPATPGLEVSFDFDGLTAESDANAFFHTQCDSNNYSWKGTNLVCLNGDPQNPFCTVWMVYFATDVNNCQGGDGGTNPDPDPDPDPNPDPNLDNLQPINPDILNPTPLGTELNDIHKDLGIIYDAILKGARQSSYTKTAIDSLMGQNFRQFTDLINSTNAHREAVGTIANDMRSDIQQQTTWIAQNQMILAQIRDAISALSNNSGGDGGSSSNGEYMQVLGYMADKLGQISSDSSNINNNAAQIPAINNILSGAITDLLGQIAQGGGGGGGGGDGGGNLQLEMQKLEMMMAQYMELTKLNSAASDIKSSIDGLGDSSDESASYSENGCVSFSCSTDSPECYIARKEWERSCAISKSEADGQGLINSLVSSVKDYTESPDSDIQNIDAGFINTDSLLKKYTNENGFNAGGQKTCPEPLPLDIGVTVLYLNLTPMCDLAAVISFFVIATAMLSSGLAIAKYS